MILKIVSLAAFGLLATTAHDPLPDLTLGTSLPGASIVMKDVSGKEMSLKDAAGKNGLVVIFSCNTCPFVIGSDGSEGWEGRYRELVAHAKRMNVGVAFVNSNEAKRADGDGFEDMQRRYKEKNLDGFYLLDKDHVVADAFGARTTPHVFLFDKDMKLAYKGAIDDNVAKAAEVKEHWLKNAMFAMTSGKPIEPATTRNTGCSIKRTPHKH
jgi:hypothetical protein